jgi:hypothetical protein
VEEATEMARSDHQLTVILFLNNNDNMKKVYARMVMRNVNGEQNMRRKEICPDLSVRYWIMSF